MSSMNLFQNRIVQMKASRMVFSTAAHDKVDIWWSSFGSHGCKPNINIRGECFHKRLHKVGDKSDTFFCRVRKFCSVKV